LRAFPASQDIVTNLFIWTRNARHDEGKLRGQTLAFDRDVHVKPALKPTSAANVVLPKLSGLRIGVRTAEVRLPAAFLERPVREQLEVEVVPSIEILVDMICRDFHGRHFPGG
jgi:hypothetical protein